MTQHSNNNLLSDSKKEIIRQYFGEVETDFFENLRLVELHKDEYLIRKGEVGHSMYILLEGLLEASVVIDGEPRLLGTIKKGESVGEMAVIEDSIRNADIKCRRKALLVKIGRDEYEKWSAKYVKLQQQVASILVRRLKEKNVKTAGDRVRSKFIAFYPISDINIQEQAELLAGYWGKDVVSVVRSSDEGVLADKEINSEQYDDKEYVILVCTGNSDTDVEFLANADKVVYFTDQRSLDEVEKYDIDPGEYDELVVLCEDQPHQISMWFKYFSPNRIFRIQKGNKSHEDRMVRLISETPICLVLGGGGAHGLSVLGLMKAFNEAQIPIDIIGGSSVGSIFAAGIAQDWSFDKLYVKIKHSLSDKNPLNDYSFPFVSLLRGRKMMRMLKQNFDMPMEDLWKNIFVIASNLSTSKQEVIQNGSLYRSIASSISIPGILPPVLHREGLLVDGGVLNNLPTDVMAQLYTGKKVAVDVVSPVARKITHHYKVNNLQFVKNMITGKKRNYVPSSMSTILKSVTLSSLEQSDTKAQSADLFVKPRIKKGFLAWKAIAEFEKEGYRAAKEALSEVNVAETFLLPK